MKTIPRRQAVRKAILFSVFLLFPVILNYLSPVLIMGGAASGIVNGSLIIFATQFLSALFLGRLWCAWICPGGGLCEATFMINNRPARGGRLNWIKYAIWGVWIAGIAALAISAGGYRQVDFFFSTETGISVLEPFHYIIYYTVIGLFFGLSLAFGRRAMCHYGCWMAPFMVLGRKISNRLGLPAMRLKADAAKCTACRTCVANCPMSLDVAAMVQAGKMENSECILCQSCVDGCPRGAIRTVFGQ